MGTVTFVASQIAAPGGVKLWVINPINEMTATTFALYPRNHVGEYFCQAVVTPIYAVT